MSALVILFFFYPIWGWAALAAWCYFISAQGHPTKRIVVAAIAATTGTVLFTPAVWGPPEGFAFFVPWGMALIDKPHVNFFSWRAPVVAFALGFCISLLSSKFGKEKRHRNTKAKVGSHS